MTPREITEANLIIFAFLVDHSRFKCDFFIRDDGALETNSVEASREYYLWAAENGFCTFETALRHNIEISKLARENGLKG